MQIITKNHLIQMKIKLIRENLLRLIIIINLITQIMITKSITQRSFKGSGMKNVFIKKLKTRIALF